VIDNQLKLAKMRFKSLCRNYDEANVKILGGFATSDQIEPSIRLEAIKELFNRGHGRPKTKSESETKHSGYDGGPLIVELHYPERKG
jgi:hypothetical protein